MKIQNTNNISENRLSLEKVDKGSIPEESKTCNIAAESTMLSILDIYEYVNKECLDKTKLFTKTIISIQNDNYEFPQFYLGLKSFINPLPYTTNSKDIVLCTDDLIVISNIRSSQSYKNINDNIVKQSLSLDGFRHISEVGGNYITISELMEREKDINQIKQVDSDHNIETSFITIDKYINDFKTSTKMYVALDGVIQNYDSDELSKEIYDLHPTGNEILMIGDKPVVKITNLNRNCINFITTFITISELPDGFVYVNLLKILNSSVPNPEADYKSLFSGLTEKDKDDIIFELLTTIEMIDIGLSNISINNLALNLNRTRQEISNGTKLTTDILRKYEKDIIDDLSEIVSMKVDDRIKESISEEE